MGNHVYSINKNKGTYATVDWNDQGVRVKLCRVHSEISGIELDCVSVNDDELCALQHALDEAMLRYNVCMKGKS